MNDIGFNVKPLNAVIKMTAIKYGNDIWYPTIKLSDSLGKSMCKDKEYSEFIQKVVRTKVEKEWLLLYNVEQSKGNCQLINCINNKGE